MRYSRIYPLGERRMSKFLRAGLRNAGSRSGFMSLLNPLGGLSVRDPSFV